MLISHEYFDGPFNPEAVDAIAFETDTHSHHRHIVLLLSSGAKINSKPVEKDKTPIEMRDQLERDINEACVDTAKLLDPEAETALPAEYNGETALPAACSYTITCKDGPLIKGSFNPRESYQVEIPAIAPQTLVLSIIPTRLDN